MFTQTLNALRQSHHGELSEKRIAKSNNGQAKNESQKTGKLSVTRPAEGNMIMGLTSVESAFLHHRLQKRLK